MADTSPTPPTGSGGRSRAPGKRLVLIGVAVALALVIAIAVIALVLSGGDQTGDGTGRDEITTTGSSDVVTAPGRSDR